MSQTLCTQYTAEPDVVRLFGRATGASTSALTSVKGKGIASIARTGVGAHTITLTDRWEGFLMFAACVIDTTTPDDWEVTVVEELVATSKTVKIAVFKGGTATDLTTDEKILFELVVSRTDQLPAGF
jgi:hypothetical protein